MTTRSTSSSSSASSTTDNLEIALAQLTKLTSSVPLAITAPAKSAGQAVCWALFGRAPADFMKRTKAEVFRQLSEQALVTIEQSVAAEDSISVRVVALPESAREVGLLGVYCAISDRPFVVDSISEFFRNLEMPFHVLLHPVVRLENGKLISLTYLEIDGVYDSDQQRKLVDDLSVVLASVKIATDDFQAMTARAHECKVSLCQAKLSADSSEIVDFLRWLTDGGYVFLGVRSWKRVLGKLSVTEDLGLFRSTDQNMRDSLLQTSLDIEALEQSGSSFSCSKVLVESPVHRRIYLDFITVAGVGANDERYYLGILGMFTFKAYSMEAAAVPLIRGKVAQILEAEQLLQNSHDYKEVVSLLNGCSKSDLLQLSLEELRQDLAVLMSIQRRNELKVIVRSVSLNRFFSVMVALPRERYATDTSERIEEYLTNSFGLQLAAADLRLSMFEDLGVALSFLVPNPSGDNLKIDLPTLEADLTECSRTWEDRLLSQLVESCGRKVGNRLFDRYSDALPESYQVNTTPESAVADIKILEGLTPENPLDLTFRALNPAGLYELKLFKLGQSLTLSSILPLLENSGFEILNETVSTLTADAPFNGSIYSLTTRLRSYVGATPAQEALKISETLIPGLRLVFSGKAENDQLNTLLVNPGLTAREVAIVRGYVRYLWQLRTFASPSLISSAVVENPSLIRIAINYFLKKFALGESHSRSTELEALEQQFRGELKSISSLLHDRILSAFLNAIQATLRTNYFRRPELMGLSFKILCSQITNMPRPRPMFEIFVSTPDVEGVHLRGGMVARGGLRWSERPDDFRTEVLGLVKTQMVKNAIIVPVGAKGGFIVKRTAGARIAPEEVIFAYEHFIRNLLDLADNRIQGAIIHPEATVIYDGDDPYFVVAADKGTAAFSDIANRIAVEEYNFWLGDAFASGGSQGYSHKKYGITAKGAWEATMVHFREVGIDTNAEEFSVVGVGDMSGDVFGNGLILSENIKLLAAFDHRHIFLDPTPDCKKSFKERLRLFELPRSSWKDYQTSLISEGGGIYDRSQKEIRISASVQKALGTDAEILSGNELIQAILRAPVDLLWNGGIGTYVKSSSQDHLAAADRANDEVRVDAHELRCHTVAEGGNLGFTQLARIEYASLGGKINTDAIDNSAGVDLSDHEVNLKILLSAAINRGELDEKERLQVLLENVEEVCERVIERNRFQSTALSLGELRSKRKPAYFRGYIRKLGKEGFLDRKGEFLPDDETLTRREQQKQGLLRPELAVVLAYSKMHVFNLLVQSSLPDDPYLKRFLFNYFPGPIQQRFALDIEEHPLRKEIIATCVANIMVETMGPKFFFRVAEETGAADVDIVAAFVAAYDILGADSLISRLRETEKASNVTDIYHSLLRVSSSLDGMTSWLLKRWPAKLSLQQLVSTYKEPLALFINDGKNLIPAEEKTTFAHKVEHLLTRGFDVRLAEALVSSAYAVSFLEVAAISSKGGHEPAAVARLYSFLGSQLSFTQLLEKAKQIESLDHWETTAALALTSALKNVIGSVVRSVLAEEQNPAIAAAERYLARRSDVYTRFVQTVKEFETRPLTIGALYVLTNQLEALGRPIHDK